MHNLLLACGPSLVEDDIALKRRQPRSLAFNHKIWDSVSAELWPIVARSLGAACLARQGKVAASGTRDRTLEILVGDNGWVDHHENGILYSFDSTKCMFSWGNLSEKLRMSKLDCRNEIVVDLFAGIGYFVLPFLVKAGAKLVYACEWNPHALEALRKNVAANFVSERCIILDGDNRIVAPQTSIHGSCPVIKGEKWVATKWIRDQRLHQEIPNSDLQVIPDCGHIPHVEKPKEITKLIVDFVV